MTLDRRSFLGSAAAGLANALAAPRSHAQVSRDFAAPIDASREQIHAGMTEGGISAAAVCLIQNGQPAWTEGFGRAGGRADRAVTADTLFSIQSTSKNFTAVAVLLAVQEGLLDLDAPISRYWPDFTVHSRFEAAPQGRMTLRMLLAHRAGFTHEAPVGNNYEPASPSFEAHVRSIADTWLRFPVGDRYRYSNLGYDLAAHLLERRTGMTFAEWLRRKLFVPLGMTATTVDPAIYGKRTDRAAGTHRGYEAVPLVTPLVASGGVWTTARDMAAYAAFHCAKGRWQGRAILAAELWEAMHGFGFGGDYGLGVMRSERRYGSTPVRLLHHRGGGFGFGCNFVYCPDSGIGWAAMFNRPALAGYQFGMELIDKILTARFGPRAPRFPAADLAQVRLAAEQRQMLIGNYVGRNVRADISEAGGTLRFTPEKASASQAVIATAPAELFTIGPDGDARQYRVHPATAALPMHLESIEGEESLDYNAGPQDRPGPDKPEWQRHVGRYSINQWGRPALTVDVERRQGYLMINGIRLVTETEPGLFFTSDGEAVDFRSQPPTWRSLHLLRA